MDDRIVWGMYAFMFAIGLLATVGYWVGRYYFNTDQEKSAPDKEKLNKDKNSKKNKSNNENK